MRGRLHQGHPTESNVRTIDFVDTGHPAPPRMWGQRQQGYRVMGYRKGDDLSGDDGVLPGVQKEPRHHPQAADSRALRP